MKLPALISTVSLIAVVGCVPQQSDASGLDVTHETEALIALESRWSEMYGNKDVDGIATLLSSDAVLLAPGQPAIVGAENVRDATLEGIAMEDTDGVSVSWASDSVAFAPSGDMAYDYGTTTKVLPDGSEILGSYLVVWIRENGEWKIAADIFNEPPQCD